MMMFAWSFFWDLEVELKIKCGTDRSQDKALISATNHYTSRGDVAFFLGRSCSAESSLETLPRAVQAIILSIRVVGVSTFVFGGWIACYSSTEESVDPTCEQVVLFESAEKIPEDGGYLTLSRKVVSVGLQGGLKLAIQAYGRSDHPSVSGLLYFGSKYCTVSRRACFVGGSEVEVTVAWSWLVQDKMEILWSRDLLPILPIYYVSLLVSKNVWIICMSASYASRMVSQLPTVCVESLYIVLPDLTITYCTMLYFRLLDTSSAFNFPPADIHGLFVDFA